MHGLCEVVSDVIIIASRYFLSYAYYFALFDWYSTDLSVMTAVSLLRLLLAVPCRALPCVGFDVHVQAHPHLPRA